MTNKTARETLDEYRKLMEEGRERLKKKRKLQNAIDRSLLDEINEVVAEVTPPLGTPGSTHNDWFACA